jgi:cell division protein FtsL
MDSNRRIHFYTDGSAARQIEPEQPQKRKSRLPKMRRNSQPVICYDPVAMLSLAVTAVMFVLLVAGVVTLCYTRAEAYRMEQYVTELEQQNTRLRQEYADSYDPEIIRQEALAMGMIPKEEAQQITVTVQVPAPTPAEPDFWEQVHRFFTSLFA